MKKLLYIITIVVVYFNSGILYSFDVESLLEKSANNLAKIKTIKAQVQQEVIIKNRSFKYVGSYSAKYPGKFKIIYTYPLKQIFWMENLQLNWYIPSKKIDTYFTNFTQQTQNNIMSKPNLIPSLPSKDDLMPDKKYYNVVYSGKKFVSLFRRDHLIQFVPKTKESGLPLIKIYINQDNFATEKILIYNKDKLTASQEYSEFKNSNGIFFPTKIIISIPQRNLTTITYYLRYKLNIPVKDSEIIEKLPPDTKKQQFNQYQINY